MAARVEQTPDRWSDRLRHAVLLDLLGSLVGVNGASISVVAGSAAQARAIVGLIPPGIDLVAPPADVAEHEGRFVWALRHHLRRAFTSVVAVAADLPALPTRTVATALSSLSAADLVVGPTTGAGLYLLGIRDEIGVAVAAAGGATTGFDGLTLNAIAAAARSQEAILRSVERRSRLADDESLDQVRDAVAATPAAAPRTAALLRTMNDPAEVAPTYSATLGDQDFARG